MRWKRLENLPVPLEELAAETFAWNEVCWAKRGTRACTSQSRVKELCCTVYSTALYGRFCNYTVHTFSDLCLHIWINASQVSVPKCMLRKCPNSNAVSLSYLTVRAPERLDLQQPYCKLGSFHESNLPLRPVLVFSAQVKTHEYRTRRSPYKNNNGFL